MGRDQAQPALRCRAPDPGHASRLRRPCVMKDTELETVLEFISKQALCAAERPARGTPLVRVAHEPVGPVRELRVNCA